jgi:hypothetical protein
MKALPCVQKNLDIVAQYYSVNEAVEDHPELEDTLRLSCIINAITNIMNDDAPAYDLANIRSALETIVLNKTHPITF